MTDYLERQERKKARIKKQSENSHIHYNRAFTYIALGAVHPFVKMNGDKLTYCFSIDAVKGGLLTVNLTAADMSKIIAYWKKATGQ